MSQSIALSAAAHPGTAIGRETMLIIRGDGGVSPFCITAVMQIWTLVNENLGADAEKLIRVGVFSEVREKSNQIEAALKSARVLVVTADEQVLPGSKQQAILHHAIKKANESGIPCCGIIHSDTDMRRLLAAPEILQKISFIAHFDPCVDTRDLVCEQLGEANVVCCAERDGMIVVAERILALRET